MSTSTNAQNPSPLRAVTWIMGAVIGLTFLFGFGNVWALAVRLGVTPWVAPLVAPAVDLSILGLLVAIRHLVLVGADAAQIRPARRLLVIASVMTLALNVAEPLITRDYGRGAFDAVGPLLLIGWSEVGPGLVQALGRDQIKAKGEPGLSDVRRGDHGVLAEGTQGSGPRAMGGEPASPAGRDLLERARMEDACHWAAHGRPISAETLRKRLHIGATRARVLVAAIRTDCRRPNDETLRAVPSEREEALLGRVPVGRPSRICG